MHFSDVESEKQLESRDHAWQHEPLEQPLQQEALSNVDEHDLCMFENEDGACRNLPESETLSIIDENDHWMYEEVDGTYASAANEADFSFANAMLGPTHVLVDTG